VQLNATAAWGVTEQAVCDVAWPQIPQSDGAIAEALTEEASQDEPVADSSRRRESAFLTEVLLIPGLESP
jgi:hypothetical protein